MASRERQRIHHIAVESQSVLTCSAFTLIRKGRWTDFPFWCLLPKGAPAHSFSTNLESFPFGNGFKKVEKGPNLMEFADEKQKKCRCYKAAKPSKLYSASNQSRRKAEADARPELLFPLAGKLIIKFFPTRAHGDLLSSSTNRVLDSKARVGSKCSFSKSSIAWNHNSYPSNVGKVDVHFLGQESGEYSQIPFDGTFNQRAPLRRFVGATNCFSYDLSSATAVRILLVVGTIRSNTPYNSTVSGGRVGSTAVEYYILHERDLARSLVLFGGKILESSNDEVVWAQIGFHCKSFTSSSQAISYVANALLEELSTTDGDCRDDYEIVLLRQSRKAKSPLQFLSNMLLMLNASSHRCKIPITPDTSANAYQILSYFLLDKTLAFRTNLIPSPNGEIENIYTYFLMEFMQYLKEEGWIVSSNGNPITYKVPYYNTAQDYIKMKTIKVSVYDEKSKLHRISPHIKISERHPTKTKVATFANFIHQKDANIAMDVVE
ncbi:hypothetical protein M9H77_31089 [Catharanthus roseus]|uniref:Uncharacterized protein n=1 Tax=Catharanthus roseus TaxID=4058 RepID=A0ACC0A0D7_CATRO|nr:hypothetical protein M9H77_31089 [Catharanthus roseus]